MDFHYQWLACGSQGGNCTEIPGAIDSRYVVEPSDSERAIRVSVTASNSAGSAEARSAPTAVVPPGAGGVGVPGTGGLTGTVADIQQNPFAVPALPDAPVPADMPVDDVDEDDVTGEPAAVGGAADVELTLMATRGGTPLPDSAMVSEAAARRAGAIVCHSKMHHSVTQRIPAGDFAVHWGGKTSCNNENLSMTNQANLYNPKKKLVKKGSEGLSLQGKKKIRSKGGLIEQARYSRFVVFAEVLLLPPNYEWVHAGTAKGGAFGKCTGVGSPELICGSSSYIFR
jgi:hypothetical protein